MTAVWRLSDHRSLSLDTVRLMGILNVTPDSFSDGGRYDSPVAALAQARLMERAGADLIDVGGESTRPGSERISSTRQLDRILPVIRAIRRESPIPISVDTTRAEVAAAAVDAGADVINDVSAGLEEPEILTVAGNHGCGVVLMHRLVPPDQDQYSTSYQVPPVYAEVVADVGDFLGARAEAARTAGVHPESILLDPGLGFGKSVDQNWELIYGTRRLVDRGWPLLGGASRKSFLERLCGPDVPPDQRDEASIEASRIQFRGGIRVFRVHAVARHRESLGDRGN